MTTALELNAEIYRTLGEIAEDENLLKRALKSLKHRLIYGIFETDVLVDVLAAY
ncbi:MAG: hypothetical protein IKR25_01945 [Muribaculaceae bacterium]|nr:hypothetical protein [Muribaculaceae bacterium]